MRKRFFIVLIFVVFVSVILSCFNRIFYSHDGLDKPGRTIASKQNSSFYLKQLIEKTYPEVIKADISDWEKVNILRQWTFENIAWASQKKQVKNLIWKKEAPEIFTILKEQNLSNKGGVDCSGYAYALMKLYKLYGYKSYIYHHGDLKGWNDVITLVKIREKGKEIIVAQQPLFDAVYTDKNNRPYDFFSILYDIEKGKMSNVRIIQGKGVEHDSYCVEDDDCNYNISTNKVIQLPDGTIKYKGKFYTEILKKNIDSLLVARLVEYMEDEDTIEGRLLLDRINKILKDNKNE